MDGGSKHPRDGAADAKRWRERESKTDPPHPPTACHLMCGNVSDGRVRQVAYAGWQQALNGCNVENSRLMKNVISIEPLGRCMGK